MEIAWKLPDQEEFSSFISVHLGCDFTPLAPLHPPHHQPSSHHPWTINISTSQSIFIIKHVPNAICGCEDTGLLFIHLIYLYFFPEGETLVSIHLCWLLAITEHLEPPLDWPGGVSTILERSTCFRAKRCVCCVLLWQSNRGLSQVWCQTQNVSYERQKRCTTQRQTVKTDLFY